MTNVLSFNPPINKLVVYSRDDTRSIFTILKLVDPTQNDRFVCLLVVNPNYADELITLLNGPQDSMS